MSPIGMAEVITLGYLVSAAVYLALAALVTRESRRVLMRGRHLSRTFYVQVGIAWMLSAAAGVSLMLQFAPDGRLLLSLGLAGTLGLLLSGALVRSDRQSPHRQSRRDLVLQVLCIASGCVSATVVQFRTTP